MKEFIQKVLSVIPYGVRKQVKNIPLVKQLQKFILEKYLAGKEFNSVVSAGPAKGLQFPVKMPQDKLMWLGTFEPDFAETMSQLIKPGFVCYDIGGYKGYFSGIMALKGSKDVYIFEPMPDNINSINRLIALNPGLPLHLVKAAVSNNSGKVSFKMMPDATMGKLMNSSFQETKEHTSEIEVDTVSLDDLISNHNYPKPDFMKIDVEGAEELVLLGAASIIAEKKPILMIEIHSADLGRKCYDILKHQYSSVKVLETGEQAPSKTLEVCHYLVTK
jgi:FkbM family methyltransferase